MNMQIKIPFNAWSKARVLDGRKICTSRTKVYGAVGDWFFVGDSRYQLNGVVAFTTHTILHYLFKAEGAQSQDELKDVFNDIFRKGPVPSMMYVHFFEVVN